MVQIEGAVESVVLLFAVVENWDVVSVFELTECYSTKAGMIDWIAVGKGVIGNYRVEC